MLNQTLRKMTNLSVDSDVFERDCEYVEISETEMRPVLMTASCRDCNVEMRPIKTLMSMPPKYVHECPDCLKEEVLSVSYPTIAWRRVEDAED